MICPNCGKEISNSTTVCPYCNKTIETKTPSNGKIRLSNYRSPLTAGVLIILAGSLGIHNFYLGQTKIGVAKVIGFILCALLESVIPQIFNFEVLIVYIINFIELILLYWHKTKTIYILSYTKTNWKILGLLCIGMLIIPFIPFIHLDSFQTPSYSNTTNEDSEIIKNLKASQIFGYPMVTVDEMIAVIAFPKWEIVDDETINVSGKVMFENRLTNKERIEELIIGFKLTGEDTVYVYAIEKDDRPLQFSEKKDILDMLYEYATASKIQH